MKSVTILLNTTESVKSFVDIAGKYDFDIDIRSGRYVVDAKSIMGIFSLNLNKPVIVEIYADKCDALLADISPYMTNN